VAQPCHRRSIQVSLNETADRSVESSSRTYREMCSKKGLSAAVLGSLLNLADAKYEDVQGLPTRVALMVDRSVTMRVMAEKYEWLAKTAANPAERQRFSDYAKLYREMELHFVEVEKPEPVGESRGATAPNSPERGGGNERT
jgi:hypothetical protein